MLSDADIYGDTPDRGLVIIPTTPVVPLLLKPQHNAPNVPLSHSASGGGGGGGGYGGARFGAEYGAEFGARGAAMDAVVSGPAPGEDNNDNAGHVAFHRPAVELAVRDDDDPPYVPCVAL